MDMLKQKPARFSDNRMIKGAIALSQLIDCFGEVE